MKDLTGQINEVAAPPSEGASGQEQLVVNGSRFLEPQLRLVERDLCAQKIEGGDSCPASMLRQPDYILLAIGGNDAKFVDMIKDGLLGKINRGIELDIQRQTKTAKAVDQMRKEYPRLAEMIRRLSPSTKTLMTIYPDPLHAAPNYLCGAKESGSGHILNRKREIGLMGSDFLGSLASITQRELTNKETVAIHDNFYLRFTGKNKGDLVLLNNEDYGGLLALGRKLSETHKGFWHVVPLNANLREPGEGSSVDQVLNGDNPYNKNRLIRDGVALKDVNQQEVDQAPCFRPKGFCVPGADAQGRWFINLEDSLDRMGAIYGTMHPNIYGQLYYVSKIYPRLPFASNDLARPRLSSLWQPHENIINEQGLHEDEQGLSCIYR